MGAVSCYMRSKYGNQIDYVLWKKTIMALWSSGSYLAWGSGDPRFESWLCQVDVESLGKALNEYPTLGSLL